MKRIPRTLASGDERIEIAYKLMKAFKTMPQSTAKRILNDEKTFRLFIRRVSKELDIPLQTEKAIAAIPLLMDYYNKVYGIDISEIAEMEFPEHHCLHAFMAVSPKHNEDEIMEAQQKYFHKKDGTVQVIEEKDRINIYRYKNPIAANINRLEEVKIQQRPSGLYVFAHSGEDEPDIKHRGKSYDDAIAEKMLFEKAKEYQLVTGFKKFTKGYFMDKKGWTRTSSLWLGGGLVDGGWSGGSSGLCMNGGDRDGRNAGCGPRELFLTL